MRKSIFPILIILIAIAAIVIFVFPSYQKLKVTQTNIEQKQQEARDLTNYAVQLQKVANQLKTSETQLSKIDQSLTQTSYLPSAFQLIQTISSSSGVKMENIVLGRESTLKENKNLLTQEINLVVLGEYAGLKNFLIALENNSRLITINKIAFSGDVVSQDKLKNTLPKMELNIEVFSYSNQK